MKPCGRPGDLAVEEERAVPHELAGGIADDEVGRGPERVLVEHEAVHAERVVDADDLARDLLAVAVDGQVGAEVGEGAVGARGDAKSWTLTRRLSGVPMGRTGAVWPSPTKTTVSKPLATVSAPPARKSTSPACVRSVASFWYWLRSP